MEIPYSRQFHNFTTQKMLRDKKRSKSGQLFWIDPEDSFTYISQCDLLNVFRDLFVSEFILRHDTGAL